MSQMRQGRLLSHKQLYESLEYLGAEKDETGKFMIWGYTVDATPPQSFLGIDALDNDILVDDSCYCMIQGKKVNLFEVAARWGRGASVTVIA